MANRLRVRPDAQGGLSGCGRQGWSQPKSVLQTLDRKSGQTLRTAPLNANMEEMMGRTLEEVLEDLPEADRAEILARADCLDREYRELLAAARMARRGGRWLSELREHVEAGGGKLRLLVEFPGQEPVNLADIGDTADSLERCDVESAVQSADWRRRGSKGRTGSRAARR